MIKTAFSINLTNLYGFAEALKLALPTLEPVAQAFMSGDFWGGLRAFANMTISPNILGQFLSLGMKYGVLRYVADNLPFKKSFTMFGLTIGV